MRIILSISFSILFHYTICAQYEWTTYSNGGDLANAVNCIEIVNNNEIWVGTLENGLQLFNGYSYQVFNMENSPLPGNRVYDIILDSNRKWVGTIGGLAIIDGDSWTLYDSKNSKLPGNTVISMIREEQGRMWYGTNEGVVVDLFGTVYNSRNSGLPGDQILDMELDSKGTIWFATEKGIASFDGVTWKSHVAGTGILPIGGVRVLEMDNNNNLWASFVYGSDGSLLRFDGTKWELIKTENNLFDAVGVYDIVSKGNGEIWFGTHHKGLMKYDGSNWEHFRNETSDIPINQIISLEVDSEGNVWMGSRKGLTKIVSLPSSNLHHEKPVESIQIIPNPFKDYTEITVPQILEKPYSFYLYNTIGKQVRLIKDLKSGSFIIHNDGLKPGLYFYKIRSNLKEFTGKLFVIE